jgi:DNA-binding transcriptional regulator YdaS (Cro superfamily)
MCNQSSDLTPREALKAVRAKFRTEQEMAEAFSVSQPTVWRWLNQALRLPAEQVLVAERLTGVSRHALRPDIYPVEGSERAPKKAVRA